MDFQQLRLNQENYLSISEKTTISARKKALNQLRNAIKKRESEIIEALYADMQKSDFEAYSSEIGFI